MNLGRISYILKENITECSQIPLKLYGKLLEANTATRFHILPSTLHDNIPRNKERKLYPYKPLDEIIIEISIIAIENECESLKRYLKNINK